MPLTEKFLFYGIIFNFFSSHLMNIKQHFCESFTDSLQPLHYD